MIRTTLLGGLALALLSAASSAQLVFQRNTADIPGGAQNRGYTENVDFGDVDGDGDFDVILAQGGDLGDDQNQIWINQGGLQGGTVGVFVDQTSTRFPSVLDQSRDIEFADIDNDGDLDIYVSNTAQISPQGNRWWVNQGGVQGGTAGFYTEETSTRWVNVGVNNGSTTFSSVPASLKLANGSFIDWSCDCDFGDLDNDGDIDLVHSTYGGAFGGDVPTRLFLNDGAGNFEEFNPSGFQLTGQNINNGSPGIWCEGTHQSNTNNSTGAQCDVASSALDIDVGDLDGDLDLDILHGAREELPRIFMNRLEENAGVLGFRDTTGSAFPSGYSTGNGHYEQEMGDLDNDDDLDIYGLNWLAQFGFDDITLANNGSGQFSGLAVLTGSGDDDNEGDFLDYDQDGDLDLYVADFAFSAPDKLYRNNYAGAGFSYTLLSGAFSQGNSRTALDADACDVDQDGDTDVIVSNDGDAENWYYKNVLTSNDVHAPRLVKVEQAPTRAPGPAPTVVRCHEYDNQPYYMSYLNKHQLQYRVNGGAFTTIPALSSAGQVLRGEIPGNVVGTIEYRFRATDHSGNVGLSAIKQFVATSGCTGSPTTYCSAKINSLGCVPAIAGQGFPSASMTSGFTVAGSMVRNNKPGLLFYKVNGTQSMTPFQCGSLCVGPSGIKRTPARSSGGNPSPADDCSGVFSIDMNAFASGMAGGNPDPALGVSGNTVHSQWWGRDQGYPAPCNTTLTGGLQYMVCP